LLLVVMSDILSSKSMDMDYRLSITELMF
jgi:hypothetical protein